MPNSVNEMPMWAKFIAYLGFPIAVATLLLFVVVKQLEGHNTLLLLHDIKVDTHLQQTIKASDEMHFTMHQLAYVLQIMCQNAAANPQDRSRCLERPQ